jgi:hypothetical protein
MGKSQRVKGHSFERRTANLLKQFDPTAKRKLEYQEGSVDIETQLPFAIQCKCQKQPSIFNAIEEAKLGKKKSNKLWALAIIKRDREEPIYAMPESDFIDLLKEWNEIRK